MNWPPIKAVTSLKPFLGYRHFVVINYWGEGKDRCTTLVSVLDSSARLYVDWNELNDSSKWLSGWLKLDRDIANPIKLNKEIENNKVCLHPSFDSELLIPNESNIVRPWFN
tara:strand:- start:97 stop:429 length:333 start_codon:yes stop_codon:yes gene_type:complete